MIKKHILVGWPKIQDFMEHPRWSECIFCQEIDEHPCFDSVYAVPEDLYNEIYNLKSPITLTEEDKQVILESANFIDHISFTEGDDINPNNLDEKLLKILYKNG